MAVIVDTNVAVVASGHAEQATAGCVDRCIDTLLQISRQGGLLIDDKGYIIAEYLKGLGYRGQPGAGHAFVKWVHDNQAIPNLVRQVPITPLWPGASRRFEEFPDLENLAGFDPDDQKFIAVAIASQESPLVINAVDTDWRDYALALADAGVRVESLCL